MSMVLPPVPWQNCRRPPPEPPEPTTGVLNCGKLLPKSSATILANGSTVDEPAIWRLLRLLALELAVEAALLVALLLLSLASVLGFLLQAVILSATATAITLIEMFMVKLQAWFGVGDLVIG